MSLASLIKTDAKAFAENEENAKSFDLLPAGAYEATVKEVEIVDFSKNDDSPYKQQGLKALNVQLRVLEGSPVGAKRVFFHRVPLFQRFLPSAKHPEGYPASAYFDFFLALGFSKEAVQSGNIDLKELGGKRIGFSLVMKDADQWHDDKFNEVSRVRAPKPLPGVAEPGVSAVGNAFQPKVGDESPWGTSTPKSDSTLQAAAEGSGKAF